MTLRYDRKKLAREALKSAKKRKDFDQKTVESLLEISQRVYALERVLAKKKILHPKEVNTELKKVQKLMVKWVNKEKKELKKKVK